MDECKPLPLPPPPPSSPNWRRTRGGGGAALYSGSSAPTGIFAVIRALCSGHMDTTRHVVRHTSNRCFLSHMASYDATSKICVDN